MLFQDISQDSINIDDFGPENLLKYANNNKTGKKQEQKENLIFKKQHINFAQSNDNNFNSPAPFIKFGNQELCSNLSLIKQSPFLKNSKSSFQYTNDDFQRMYTNEDIQKSQKFDDNLDSGHLSSRLFKSKSPLEDSVNVSEFSMNSCEDIESSTPEIKFNLQKNYSGIILNDWSDSPNLLQRRNSDIIERDSIQMSNEIQIKNKNLQKEIQEFKKMRINISKFNSIDHIKDNLEVIHEKEDFDELHPFSIRLFQDEQEQHNKMEIEETTPMRKLGFRKNLGNILENNNNIKNNLNGQFYNKNLKIIQVLSKSKKMNVYICRSNLNKQKYLLKEICIIKELQEETISDLRILAKWGQGDKKENEHFVKFYDSWIYEGKLCVVTELCQSSLEKIIKPSENTIRKIIIEISTGLNFLHQQKCYHMVLKPSNILLSYSEKFKIADLGVSWLNHQFISDYWSLDKRYFSPEFDCRLEQDIDYEKCDIYSFGVILHELVEGSYQRKKNKKITNNQKFSNSLTYLIKRMTDQCPSKRPSAQEILDKMFKGGDEDYLQIETRYLKEQNEVLQRKVDAIQIKLQENKKIDRKNSAEF